MFILIVYLTAFSMIGVLVRYELSLAFGSTNLDLLSPSNAEFTDLASNILGSFIMGITGVVYKPYIKYEPLLLGLSTALCGSITTYSS